MSLASKLGITRMQAFFTDNFGMGKGLALTAALLIFGVLFFAIFWFFYSAPPRTLVISSGPEGTMFRTNADRLGRILAKDGVTLKILDSQGSRENLLRLLDPKFRVDVGFVQGGASRGMKTDKLVSLGTLYQEPLLIFYRSEKPIEILSALSKKKIGVGPEGSGTRQLAMTVLGVNGINTNQNPSLLSIDGDDAADLLLAGKVDAVFLMGDSAASSLIRKLLKNPDIQLYDYVQADGYTRRISYLNKLEMPQGAIDFGKNIPSHEVSLIGPNIELIARENLHPALSDLLLEAAREVYGRPGLYRRQGQFPAAIEREIPISADATRFYKSGKSFLYRTLPFWLASLVNRIIFVFLPILVIMIPGIRVIPALYNWRITLGINRWYRAMLALEQDMVLHPGADRKPELLGRLAEIERAVDHMKVPASFANQFYALRLHIGFVRDRLSSKN